MYNWNDNYTSVQFEELLGKTIVGILISDNKEEMRIRCTNGCEYVMSHDQDCCECVYIEDVAGHLSDLIDAIVLEAEEVTSNKNPRGVVPEYQDSFTWTFYKLRTVKGAVTIRWYGESNGYYSESVSLCRTNWKKQAVEAPVVTVVPGITGEWT